MTFLLWIQAAQSATEPFTLTAIVFAFAGIAALFLINLTIKNDGRTKDLIRDVRDLAHDFKAHVTAEEQWQHGILRQQRESDERHAGNYDNLLRNFRETKDAMMDAVLNRPKTQRHTDR